MSGTRNRTANRRRRSRHAGNSDFAALLHQEFKPKTDRPAKRSNRRCRRSPSRRSPTRRWSPTMHSARIEAMIAAIDRKLTEQVNLIMHHDDFQQLEARGAACGTWSATPRPTRG